MLLACAIDNSAGDHTVSCSDGDDSCPTRTAFQRDHVLLQSAIKEHQLLFDARKGKRASLNSRKDVTSDCASRLHDFAHQGGAACIVVRDNRALLVKVPYGRHPGWDLPGGLGDKGQEAGCETAEREVCEETGYQVRAIAKLSSNVFRCEVIASNVCTEAVDEGFLKREWFTYSQLHSLDYRGYTWGDKQGLLKQHVAPASTGGADECGCIRGQQGWSQTRHGCYQSSETDSVEAAQCLRTLGNVDECGCTRGQEGWSSTRRACHPDSATVPSEVVQCSQR